MKRALLVIDFINEFVHPEGKISPQGMGRFCEEFGVIKNTRKLIDSFRKKKEEIVWIHIGFHENYDNCSKVSPRFKMIPDLQILQEGTWSVDFIEGLKYNPNEKTFTKTQLSAFYKTGLEEYLDEKGIGEIIITGVATDLAVSSTARDAHDRDILTTVISDACGTVSKEHHEAALLAIRRFVSVKSTGDFLDS
ncbi:MAG: cysteine hydrolase [Candidatus Altimarinota bacterium]